jgi:hypothetical protein
MDSLSDELLLLIVAWVPPLDLLQSVALVNKRWARQIELHWTQQRQLFEGDKKHGPSSRSPTNDEGKTDNVSVHEDGSQALLSSLNSHQLQRCCIFSAAVAGQPIPLDSSLNVPSCLKFGSVLPSQEIASTIKSQWGLSVCSASTTDNVGEDVENVLPGLPLPPRRQARISLRNVSWWSSRAYPSTESTETLLFTTNVPLVFLTRVLIQPLLDPYDSGVCYTWKRTIIRAYRLPLESLSSSQLSTRAGFPCVFGPLITSDSSTTNEPSPSEATMAEDATVTNEEQRLHHNQHALVRGMFVQRLLRAPTQAQMLLRFFDQAINTDGEAFGHPRLTDTPMMNALLMGHEPVYESPELEIPPNESNTLTFDISTPMGGVVANVIAITLIDKNHEQHQGVSGYYACVENVDCSGIPLYSSHEEQIYHSTMPTL